MAVQPNHGRDIETDILRVLAEGPATIQEVRCWLIGAHPVGGPPARSTVARHLVALTQPPPERRLVRLASSGRRRGAVFALTDEGRRVAEARGLTRRADR